MEVVDHEAAEAALHGREMPLCRRVELVVDGEGPREQLVTGRGLPHVETPGILRVPVHRAVARTVQVHLEAGAKRHEPAAADRRPLAGERILLPQSVRLRQPDLARDFVPQVVAVVYGHRHERHVPVLVDSEGAGFHGAQ